MGNLMKKRAVGFWGFFLSGKHIYHDHLGDGRSKRKLI